MLFSTSFAIMFNGLVQCLGPSLPLRTRVRGSCRSLVFVGLTTLLLTAFIGTSNAQTNGGRQEVAAPATSTPLELGKPLPRELAAGQRHGYGVSLQPDQAIRVWITADGIDVGADLRTPEGKLVRIYDAFGDASKLKVDWVARSSGVYHVEVFARARGAAGRYEIVLESLKAATAADRSLQEARELFAEFGRLTAEAKYTEARAPLLRALAIRESVLGPNDLVVAQTLGFVSSNYHVSGDLAQAMTYRLRAIKIIESNLGPNDPALGTELIQLAGFYFDQRDFERSIQLHERALSIFERANRSDTAQVATILGMMGNTYYLMGDYPNAEQYYERSRAIFERILGPDNYHLAPSYRFLGSVAYDAGNYQKAETMFQRAFAIAEKGIGPEHPSLTRHLNDLAMLKCTVGEFAQGESLYQRAVANHERNANLGHPGVRDALMGLAKCYADEGKLPEALKAQSRANELAEQFLAINLASGSERERLAILSELSSELSRNISFHLQLAPTNPLARELAITSILQRKGRIQDALADSLAALRERSTPADRALIERLNTVNSDLSKLILSPPPKSLPADREKQLNALAEERDSLEDQIGRQSAGFYQRSRPVTLAAVQAAVPASAALIEFSVYRPFDPDAPDNEQAFGPARYAAYVIRPNQAVTSVDLGKAGVIDAAVARFRRSLRDPHSRDLAQRARELDQRLMQPIRPLLGDAGQLLISPDGQLNLVPFAALVDERGKYLLERFEASYLTSGRELLRLQVERNSDARAVVIANPRFGESLPAAARRSTGSRKPSAHTASRWSSSTASDLSSIYFAPLSGTELEARSIQTQFPDAKLLLGAQATEAALKQAVAPSILHIATHGFFLAEAPGRTASTGSRGASPSSSDPYSLRLVGNPLLRSGLAFADANLHSANGDDGILTSSEAAGLNLWGTQLVVLSACDTGVGEVRTGEGVYGLRRAFVLAGAESLVMSLWPISDQTTRKMMARYYELLRQGGGRGAALRQVQLEMLRKDPALHPFYWANFIESGEWARLEEKR
jgi:CHAT domain-containing protein